MAPERRIAVAEPPPDLELHVVSQHRNEVVVAGRLSKPAIASQLPSGDELMTWRLVVDHADDEPAGFDVVECRALSGRVRRQARAWVPGDIIEARGALRHRYWRGPAGLRSKCEVEVVAASRLSRAPRPTSRDETEPLRRRRKPG